MTATKKGLYRCLRCYKSFKHLKVLRMHEKQSAKCCSVKLTAVPIPNLQFPGFVINTKQNRDGFEEVSTVHDESMVGNENDNLLDGLVHDVIESTHNMETSEVEHEEFVLPPDCEVYLCVCTLDDKIYIQLEKLMRDLDAPQYAFDKVLEWASSATSQGFKFSKHHPKLLTFMGQLATQMKNVAPPLETTVALESDADYDDSRERNALERTLQENITVHHFDFMQTATDFLENREIFGDLNNLNVNADDPFLPYEPSILDSSMAGELYAKTWKDRDLEPGRDFVLPMSIYLDKSPVDKLGRFGVEPVLYTFLILKRHLRNNPDNWPVLGYVPDLEQKSSARKIQNRRGKKRVGCSLRNYHACLRVILKSLVDVQRQGGIEHFLRLGNKVRRVRLHFIVHCFIQDSKAADVLSGRIMGNKNAICISQFCFCPQRNCSNPTRRCRYIVQKDVDDLQLQSQSKDPQVEKCAKKLLCEKFYLHPVDNALKDVDYADNHLGYFSALPIDPMHAFLEGLLEYTIGAFFKPITKKGQAQIDAAIDELFLDLRSGEKWNFPRFKFQKGISNLTMVCADEWPGIAFNIVMLALTAEGRKILEKRFDVDEEDDGKDETAEDHSELRKIPLTDFIEVFECMLCFHAWYKQGSFWNVEDEDLKEKEEKKANKAIKKMIKMICDRVPRLEGNGYDLQKVHGLFDLVRQMKRLGPPSEFDTGVCESFHKNNVKLAAS